MEPWGCEAEDVRLALLRSSTVNVWAGKGKAVPAREFLPSWRKVKQQQTQAEMEGVMNRVLAPFLKPQEAESTTRQ